MLTTGTVRSTVSEALKRFDASLDVGSLDVIPGDIRRTYYVTENNSVQLKSLARQLSSCTK
jgi:DNA-binding transcriptional regulator GbsR (MarR family)